MRITDLLHYRWRGEPGVLLQDCLGKVLSQPGEVTVPHVFQILAVFSAQWLIPHYEALNEPRTSTNNLCLAVWLHWSDPGHSSDSPLDDLDGPCPLFSLLSGHQTSPAVFDLRGYFRRKVRRSHLKSAGLPTHQPLSVFGSLLSFCSPCTWPGSLLLQQRQFRTQLQRLNLALLWQLKKASPSLCLQTWKASSVANKVLGCRMKIFVLERDK